MMKTTHEERVRIRAWLEKDPQSRDTDKILVLPRGDQDNLRLARTTYYFGKNWKVRIAYEIETDYPILMSSPIPANMDSKKKNSKAPKMVPKLPAKTGTPKAAPTLKKSYFSTQLWNSGVKPVPKTKDMSPAVSYKAIKGSKALYGTWSTIFVVPGKLIPGTYYQNVLAEKTVPKGYKWMPTTTGDYYLVKK